MEPWQSWTAALVVGGGLFYYYTKDTNVSAKVSHAAQSIEQPQTSAVRRRQDKQTGRVKSTVSNVADQTKQAITKATEATSNVVSNTVNESKRKKKIGTQSSTSKSTPLPQVARENHDEEDEDESVGDKEWAAQLQARQKGISLTAPSITSKQSKVKQPKATSGDPTVGTSVRTGGDVADMLETPGPAPSILRIVGEEKPKKQQAPKVGAPQETKKQRQNRKKVEEERQIREEQEKERQVLLEKQRRTAREARGEPAKNGLTSSKAPASSAWSASSQASENVSDPIARANGVELLDTFDHDNASTSSSNGVMTNGTTPDTAASTTSTFEQSYPSEVAQLEQINEMSGWAEVSKPKKGKKKTQAQSDGPDSKENKTESVAPNPKPVNTGAQKAASPPKPTQQPATNAFSLLEESPTYMAPTKGHPDDSDWL